MINKRLKQGIIKVKRPKQQLKMSLGTIAIILCCLMLILISTFTQIKIHYSMPEIDFLENVDIKYIPQIPTIIFISALLGRKWAMITVLFYILVGLTTKYSIFALGGGFSYIFEYSFGYILGFLFGAFACAKALVVKKGQIAFLKILYAPILSVLVIHFIGILYMVVIAVLRHDSLSYIQDLIYYQSLTKIAYDIIFSLLAIIFAKICKKFLWIIPG